MFAPPAEEKADLNTLVHYPGLFVLVTQRTAAPGFAQYIVDLGVRQALTLVFKLSLCKLVHPISSPTSTLVQHVLHMT